MSFARYPEYKDSGVEWLGDVPAHWVTTRLRYVCECLDGRRIPLNSSQRADKHGDIPYWGANSIVGYVDEALFDEDLIFLGEDGAPFFEPSKPVAFFSQGKVWPNNHVHVLRPSLTGNSKFITYVLNVTDYSQFIDGSTRDKLTQGSMNDIPLTWPTRDEQTQIATFLDRETAKIDGLVAEQRRLMALLQEKRQAVISHAVTRGLNPDASMKPSGIEWLGDVPAHWEVKRIKFVIANVKAGPFGSALTKDVYVSAGFRVYGQEQVIPNDFSIGDYFITPEKYRELSQYSVSPGDILISCVGTFGKIAIVPDTIEPGIINPRLIRLRCSSAIKAEYLVEVMRSNVTFEQFTSFTRGGTMDVINIGTLNEIFVALPPMTEQEKLLIFIQHEIAKFDTLTAEAQRAIDLLQERRTALISAAVTGQIDLRQLA